MAPIFIFGTVSVLFVPNPFGTTCSLSCPCHASHLHSSFLCCRPLLFLSYVFFHHHLLFTRRWCPTSFMSMSCHSPLSILHALSLIVTPYPCPAIFFPSLCPVTCLYSLSMPCYPFSISMSCHLSLFLIHALLSFFHLYVLSLVFIPYLCPSILFPSLCPVTCLNSLSMPVYPFSISMSCHLSSFLFHACYHFSISMSCHLSSFLIHAQNILFPSLCPVTCLHSLSMPVYPFSISMSCHLSSFLIHALLSFFHFYVLSLVFIPYPCPAILFPPLCPVTPLLSLKGLCHQFRIILK
jgi:hypothetical protein